MKISCLPVSLFGDIQSGNMSLREWAESAKKIGFDGIDLSMLMLNAHTQTYIERIQKDFKEVGLPLVMATTYPDFTHPDPKQRLREADYLMRDIALCDQLGIQYLRVLAGQAHDHVSLEEGVTLAVEYLRQTDAAAKKYDVKLLYENHAKPGAWSKVDFSYPLDIFFRVFNALQDTNIRLNFDIGNIVAQGKDPLPVLEKVIDRVETVHISDMSAYGKFEPVEIGTGVCPIEAVLKRLKAYGFDGWLCIEEASGHGLEGISNAWNYVNSLVSQL